MKKGENFSESEWAALSVDQQEQALRIEKAVRDFLGDSKSIRYMETEANRDALLKFLADHSLETTHANLLFGYSTLCAEGGLELIPFAPVAQDLPPAPSQPPIPVPTAPDPRAPQAWRNGKAIELTNPRPL